MITLATQKLGRNVTPTERLLLMKAWRLHRHAKAIARRQAAYCHECGARMISLAVDASDDTREAVLARVCPNDGATYARATT